MKQIVSPIFQSFLVLLHQNKIDEWTSNQIWNKLNLSEDEKQRINQQQLYRILRKLVKQGYLAKNIHSDNSRLSTFVETENMYEFRKQFDLIAVKSNLKKLVCKTTELKEKQKSYENQIKACEQALIDFPELKTEIIKRKNKFNQNIEEIKYYSDFLKSLLESKN